MTCDDYLAMLATVPADELAYGRARAHAATCHDCDRVTRVVAERERNLQHAFADLRASVPATQTAHHAVSASRRRAVARTYKFGLGVVAVVTIAVMALTRRVIVPTSEELMAATVKETFRLQCLSPAQAAEALRPHVAATGRIRFHPASPLGLLDVEASRAEMEIARTMMAHYDDPSRAQCAVKVTVPPLPPKS